MRVVEPAVLCFSVCTTIPEHGGYICISYSRFRRRYWHGEMFKELGTEASIFFTLVDSLYVYCEHEIKWSVELPSREQEVSIRLHPLLNRFDFDFDCCESSRRKCPL